MERSSLALWNYEPPDGIVAAREEALQAGALVVVAHLDNFLGLQAHDRGNMDQIDPAARRCVELAGKLRLPALHGVGTVVLAFGAAYRGDAELVEAYLAEADARSGHHPDVIALAAVARARYWVYRDDLDRTLDTLRTAMDHLRRTPAIACPERGLWALHEAIAGDGHAAVAELDEFIGPNHVMIDSYRNYSRAVLRGREGAADDAARHVALAERVQPTPWFQHHARRLVAESAHRDGWGDPTAWLRDAHTYFDGRGEQQYTSSCRSLLAKFGAALPRRRQTDDGVPASLIRYGISAREAEVWELLGEARSTRSIAETLYISPKTVERHIANLATKLGVDGRAAVVAHAARASQPTAD
jgi:DNA-binding CsgD family transcriptional regulator